MLSFRKVGQPLPMAAPLRAACAVQLAEGSFRAAVTFEEEDGAGRPIAGHPSHLTLPGLAWPCFSLFSTQALRVS